MIDFTAAATVLLVWGIVLHLVADFLFQSEWMALNKAKRRDDRIWDWETSAPVGSRWWDRHPAAYIHAGLHTFIQLLVFPWWAALAIGIAHFVIDLGWPVDRWSKLVGKTLPEGKHALLDEVMVSAKPTKVTIRRDDKIVQGIDPMSIQHSTLTAPLLDIGTLVKILTDQVFHIVVLAIAAVVVA